MATECGLDPALLSEADTEIDYGYAVIRYGKLCHEHYPTSLYPGEVDQPESVGGSHEAQEYVHHRRVVRLACVGVL